MKRLETKPARDLSVGKVRFVVLTCHGKVYFIRSKALTYA